MVQIMEKLNNKFRAKGKLLKRLRSILFLLPAWYAPHTRMRVFFHRLRGVRIGRGVEIGYFCIIGNVHPQLITLGDHAVVTAGTVLLEHDNAHYYTRGGNVKFGPVVLEKGCFVGLHSVVMPNVTIGERSIVGPNSVVTKDVPPDALVSGIPAQIIK